MTSMAVQVPFMLNLRNSPETHLEAEPLRERLSCPCKGRRDHQGLDGWRSSHGSAFFPDWGERGTGVGNPFATGVSSVLSRHGHPASRPNSFLVKASHPLT